jgi:anoctamin-10
VDGASAGSITVDTENCNGETDAKREEKLNGLFNEQVLGELRIQLATLFGSAVVIQNSLEVIIPWVVTKIKGDQAAKAHAAENEDGKELQRSEAEFQMDKVPYDNTIDDMSELIIQFGYVALFALALPITPLLALLNNVVEMKVDAVNLVNQSQRPHPNGSSGLGAWNPILQFFSFICIGTNIALITWRTGLVQDLTDSVNYNWIFFSVSSIVVALMVAFEKYLIPDIPLGVQAAMERQKLIEGVLVLGQRIDSDREMPPDDEDEGYLDFNPTGDFVDHKSLPQMPQGSLAHFKPEA